MTSNTKKFKTSSPCLRGDNLFNSREDSYEGSFQPLCRKGIVKYAVLQKQDYMQSYVSVTHFSTHVKNGFLLLKFGHVKTNELID